MKLVRVGAWGTEMPAVLVGDDRRVEPTREQHSVGHIAHQVRPNGRLERVADDDRRRGPPLHGLVGAPRRGPERTRLADLAVAEHGDAEGVKGTREIERGWPRG